MAKTTKTSQKKSTKKTKTTKTSQKKSTKKTKTAKKVDIENLNKKELEVLQDEIASTVSSILNDAEKKINEYLDKIGARMLIYQKIVSISEYEKIMADKK